MELNAVLLKARKDLNISQRDLAKKLGYRGPQIVSNWERNLNNVPLKKMKKLIKILNLNSTQTQQAAVTQYSNFIKKYF